jgi:HD-GYP domain-containing protein (c-di-GMP phosphodiesterase class II)
MPVQLSLGYAWSDHSPVIADLWKEADARMYREKDLRRESVRMGYIANLQRRFEELHRNDANTTQRLVSLSERFAKHLGIMDEEITKLLLLARYRDIGKVGISERVMLKPGALDLEEQNELRKQPEIGYRIAKISRELAPIAEYILKHREWWDGRGYPLGLVGEHIPILNRILSVVETYVAMTGPRVRSRSFSVEEALEEIILMSGKKLDPKIVASFSAFLRNMS